MEKTEDEILFLARFQSLKFDKNLENGTPSQKADILRNIIVHLSSASHYKIVSDVTSDQIKQDYVKKYQSIVDCFDETKGLNNFAAGALSLCTGKKNESQLWKSSLDINKLEREPYFQEYLDRYKSKSSFNDDTQPLFKPRKKKIVPDAVESKQEPEKPKLTLPSYFTGAGQNTGTSSSNTTVPPSYNQLPNRTTSSSTTGQSWLNTSSNLNRQASNPVVSASNKPHTSYVYNTTPNPNQSNYNTNSGQQSLNPSGNQTFVSNNTRNDNFHNQVSSRPNPVSVYGNTTNTGRGECNTEEQFVARQPQYQQKKSLFSENSRSSYKETSGGSWNQRRKEWKKRQRSEMEEEDDDEEEEMQQKPPTGPFKTARDQLAIDQSKKYGGATRGQPQGQVSNTAYGGVKKSLGTRRGPSSKFIPPVISRDEEGCMIKPDNRAANDDTEELVDERLKGIDPKMIELINNEIMDHGPKLTWEDVAGLEFAKKTIKEIVVWPMLRPDIFTGLRGPPKGLLLFGPPGTGKTLIGKCIASQSKSTFFCISASSLTSKWVGEGEKMVRALFAVARCNQPAVIFIDEIDSLLSQRSDNEHEASRRIKTEFLVQLDGAATDSEDRILIIGATNRPQEIDEAARRRFVKRLYIPLPEDIARRQIVVNLLKQQKHQLTDQDLDLICQKSDGYSGSDMANLCREAALGPIRSIPFDQIETITNDEVRAISLQDFIESLTQVRASVSVKDLDLYIEWNQLYGSFGK